jgi:hypothetical protein
MTVKIKTQQQNQLRKLLNTASTTEFGRKYNFEEISNYRQFRNRLPIFQYEDISGHIKQLKEGSDDLLWPGKVNRFAISAGTSGEGKHLPLTPERLNSDRLFMRDIITSYIKQRPNLFNLFGKQISLPGFLEQKENFEIGEISAYTARRAPKWLSFLQLLSPEELIQLPFSSKINRLLEKAISNDIRVITAAPSWVLTFFQRVIEETGKDSVGEVWPNLQLLVCGGVKLDNYRPHLEKLMQKPDVDFIETYGASEGYFAFSDNLERRDLKLVTDHGIFYEFIPHPEPGDEALKTADTIPLWEVQPDIPYAMLVTTNAGLWRYALNDIVTFTDIETSRIEVMGRVSEMMDDYGEALYAYEAEQALEKASDLMDLSTGNFTVASTMSETEHIPHHLWFVHFTTEVPEKILEKLALKVDDHLQKINRHYAIRRESGALGMPKLQTISQETINQWLKMKGKEKAQGKLPSILHENEDIQFFSENKVST